MLNLVGLDVVQVGERDGDYLLEARRMDRGGNGYSFEGLKKRLLMAHGLQFRETPPAPAFSFDTVPVDIRKYEQRWLLREHPVETRPVIGYRLSTLAKIAGKVPLD